MPSDTSSDDYTVEDVEIFRDTSHIRQRPGMYVGDTGVKGLHNLLLEVVHNSVNEAVAGHCHYIDIEILADNSVRVSDDGRGIPVEAPPDGTRSVLEIVMTRVGATGKFNKDAYSVSAGLHGIGLKAVCALSEWCEAEVCRGGRRWAQRFSRCFPVGPLEDRGPADRTGTRITFLPDPDIFRDTTADFGLLEERLRELASLNRGLRVRLTDRRTTPPREELFHFPDGIVDYLRFLNRDVYPVHSHIFYCRGSEPEQEVEVALQWTAAPGDRVHAYANCARIIQGTPLAGLRNAVTQALRGQVRGPALLPVERAPLVAEDYRCGLTGVVAVNLAEPIFGAATRQYLQNPEVATLVNRVVRRELVNFLHKHPDDAGAIATRVLIAQATRLAHRRRRP